MKIVSLLPSATEILKRLGLLSSVIGVTDKCYVKGKRVVLRARVGNGTGAEIDSEVREMMNDRQPLYDLDWNFLAKAKPEVIITQDLCHVCSLTTPELNRELHRLPVRPKILSLSPKSLADVLFDINLVGKVADRQLGAGRVVKSLRSRLNRIGHGVSGKPRPKVLFLEWLDPPFLPGHWVPEQIRKAGGNVVLGREGQSATEGSVDRLRDEKYDLVLLAPCGCDSATTVKEVGRLGRAGRLPYRLGKPVYVLDERYFACPGPGLVDGVEILARILHPELRHRVPPKSWRKLN